MILLDATTRKLQIVLAAAKTTNDSPWVASYVDIAQAGFAMQNANSATGNSNGVTAVDVVAAPGAGNTRQLKYFSLLNADTVAITATVQFNDNATIRKMVTFIIPVGASLVYNAESGWIVQSYKAGQVLGTATNDAAAAGNVGELIATNVPVGSAVSVTTGNVFNIASVSLTPGDWNVWGEIATSVSVGTNLTQIISSISTVSATQGTAPNGGALLLHIANLTSQNIAFPIGQLALSLAITTTVYLIGRADFTTQPMSLYGYIGARRMR